MNVTSDRIDYPEGWEEYRGRWVAIRAGQIIATAMRLDELFGDEQVERRDAVWHVPEEGFHLYSSSRQA